MTTTEPKPKRKHARRTTALIVALLCFAAPAGASIIVQNYMEADVVAAPPCFVKTAGADPTGSTLSTFDATGANTIAVDGVDLLEEKISVTGMIGDRVIYTDVVHYENNCTEPITMNLTTVTAGGDWTGVSMELWVSNVAAPADIDPNLDAAGGTSDWNDTAISVPAGTTAGPLTLSTGTVTIPALSEVHGAFVVSTDNTAATGDTATLNWMAEATIN